MHVGQLISQHCEHLTKQRNYPMVLYIITLTQLLVGNLPGVPKEKKKDCLSGPDY